MNNTLDLEFIQGNTISVLFPLTNPNGSPFNLTGFDARLQIRKSFGATTAVVNATLANSKLSLGTPALGQVTLTLAPTDTSTIRFNAIEDEVLECVYDLELTRIADGWTTKPTRGTFTLNREVTR